MPDSFYYSITVALIAFSLIWIIGPAVVYLTIKTTLPEFFSLTDAEIESLTAADFNARSNEVVQLGFEPITNMQWIMASSSVISRVFYNRDTHELAHVSDITAHNQDLPSPPVRLNYAEFVTTYYGAPQINTNNGNLPSVYRPDPEKEIRSLPGVRDASTIYCVHRHLTSQVSAEVRSLPSPGSIEQVVEMESIQTLRRQVEFGYLFFDEPTSTFRPTVMGSILMTWKMIWPVGAIRRHAMRENARQLIARAGA